MKRFNLTFSELRKLYSDVFHHLQLADKITSSICDKIVNLPYWCYFEIKSKLHNEAKRLILEKMVEIIN